MNQTDVIEDLDTLLDEILRESKQSESQLEPIEETSNKKVKRPKKINSEPKTKKNTEQAETKATRNRSIQTIDDNVPFAAIGTMYRAYSKQYAKYVQKQLNERNNCILNGLVYEPPPWFRDLLIVAEWLRTNQSKLPNLRSIQEEEAQ